MWQKIKNVYHLLVAILANALFLFPGRGIKVIGVTGTDGKTTTATLIAHILKQSGHKTSFITSIEVQIGNKKFDTEFHVTTPSSFFLQKSLRQAVSQGSEYFVLEVTSHAIDQGRILGIPFEVAVLTNISHEHLDYHKTYENYVKTKEKILKIAKFAVLNRDDKSFDYLLLLKNKKHLITYGLGKSSDVNPSNFKFETTLLGDFNKHNILAAISCCKALGIEDEKIRAAIASFKTPEGRLNFVYDKSFKVVIDFAHTPNAFEKVLSSLRPAVKGKIIHVFGSAGERDREKRPLMGKVSSRFADIIILTSEDPRGEDINEIISEIESGIKNSKDRVLKFKDRAEAIGQAIKMAKPGDLVLITGKGHERSMNLGKGEESWDEFEVVKKAIEARKNGL